MPKTKIRIDQLFFSGVVSCLGLGYFPKGSGTVASFFALLFWVLVMILSEGWVWVAGLSFVICILGTLAIQQYQKGRVEKDGSEIVIDEWVGMGISLIPCKLSLGYLLAAFVLFRIFDIFKPIGVRYFDQNHLKGWGVMLDDVVAGIYAAILIGAFRWFAA